MCRLVVAKRTSAAPGRRVLRGTVLCADDPAVKRAPGLFEPYLVRHHCADARPPVEQATAAPGEQRPVPESARPRRTRKPDSAAEE